MVRFRMLGATDLRGGEGQELGAVLRRPKLLALLGYLAAARPAGYQRRDALVALLWPELDTAHARSALRQALHALRDAVGPGVVVARGDEEVGLDEAGCWCDVREFERALAAARPEPALELYRGGLLTGLHLTEAPDFERWLDEEREHLRRRACQAAQELADRAQAEKNGMAAARWALRLVELAPFDEPAVRQLMQLLDQAGDRAGAIRAYEEFEGRMGRELEVLPSAETRALMQKIRARQLPHAAAVAGERGALTRPGATDGETAAPTSGRTSAPRLHWVWRRRRAGLLLVLAILLLGGWLLLRARSRYAEAHPTPKRLVVLPLTNLGPAQDEFFADGITEEIAARLQAIDRLQVIGQTSANHYKRTNATLPQIGKELGVGYALEGSVEWQQPPRGTARVRVTTQLVTTADGTRIWSQVYDEPLDSIFRVQSDIARRVVQALDLTLLEPQRRVVEAVPTHDLQAYEYYLRGNDFSRRGQERRFQLAAARMFEKAIELDSGFALAYAMLSRVHSRMYLLYYDHSLERLALAKWAVDKAFELQPDLPEAHHSLGTYYWIGHFDYDRALREYAIAERTRPNEVNVFLARAVLRSRQGRYADALADFAKARELDPSSASVYSNYGEVAELTRDFGRAEPLYDRAIALSPDWPRPYFLKAGLCLRRDGSTRQARAVLDEAQAVGLGDAPDIVLARVWVAMFDRQYDEAITRLSSGAPEVFADQFHFMPRAQLYAQVYGLMGRRDLERAYYDSARAIVVAALQDRPEDARLHSALGIADAGVGRKAEAVQEGLRGAALLPVSREAYQGYYRAWDLAHVYAMVGRQDSAVGQLAYLLSIPGPLTPAWLRVDPMWDRLRADPRFRRLAAEAH